jgi:cobalt-zinc-cadmium efflux system membrane fusion protein
MNLGCFKMKTYCLKGFTATSVTLGLAVLLGVVSSLSFASGGHDHGVESHEEMVEKGPNNGRLFYTDQARLELAIFERGVPPEFRAWITDLKGAPITSDRIALRVTLARLGGPLDVHRFSQQGDYWLGNMEVFEPHSFDVTVHLSMDGQWYEWRYASHEGRTQIHDELAQQIGITTAKADAGVIQHNQSLYGQLVMNPANQVKVQARFAGVLTQVNVSVGEAVKKGQILAEVESNQSLQRYSIKAPMSGTVVQRHVNVGEQARDQDLFVIENYTSLLVEMRVFPAQQRLIKVGQTVYLKLADEVVEATIQSILPATLSDPFRLARAVVDNPYQQWLPGMWLNAQVNLAETQVALRVDNRALQSFRD